MNAKQLRKKVKMTLSGISPELTIRMIYLYNFKKPLNLKKLDTLNEKLQYLKLRTYSDNETVTLCVDKLRVREYLAKRGLGHLSATLIGGVY